MQNFLYPTSIELAEIEQDLLPRLEADRPVFDFFPTMTEDAYVVAWEQMDNYVGLQQVRGLNGEFPHVKRVGLARYEMTPGVYGEYEALDEAYLTQRRQIGTLGTPIDLSDGVMPIQNQLLQRRLDRIEWMIWTLIINGVFTVTGPTGAILHTDAYNTQVYNALTSWTNKAASTPAYDFRQLAILARGHSVSFGADAKAFMNQNTFNNLALNNNATDLFGRRTKGLATINNLKDMNELLQGDNMPEIVIYERGYFDDAAVQPPSITRGVYPAANFHTYLPDNTVAVIGKRPGSQPVGRYKYTRNANNPDLGPGPYMEVIDTLERGGRPPRQVQVFDGHNGGLALEYPSAIVIMNV